MLSEEQIIGIRALMMAAIAEAFAEHRMFSIYFSR